MVFQLNNLNEEHTRVLQEALDLYLRLGMGQIDPLLDLLQITRLDEERYEDSRKLLENFKHRVFGFHPSRSYSIYSDEIRDDFRVAWDMHRVIRHKVSWARNPAGGWTVNFDKARQTSMQPLIDVEYIKDEKEELST